MVIGPVSPSPTTRWVSRDPFTNEDGTPRKLMGAAALLGAVKIAELAGRVGFDTVWIEVEHGGASFTEVEELCMATEVGGAVPTVRLPDHSRFHVLRALEAGARIVVCPMVNNADIARELVRHGKFPPIGQRGFNTRSRGLNYGLDGVPNLPETFAVANAHTHLIAQIETMEAAENIESICAVDGISGILIGPGDLSVSYGKPAAFTDPAYIEFVAGLIRRARGTSKHAGIMVAPGPMLDAVMAAGCDLAFFAGDVNDLARAWRGVLAPVQELAAKGQ
jgi:4-hydroxy-2-oxoheptanedioate aldolase